MRPLRREKLLKNPNDLKLFWFLPRLIGNDRKNGGGRCPKVEQLIKQAQQGDPEAFIELMELNKQSMYKAARAILRNTEDVADAMQETILSCFQNIKNLKQPRYFKTWLTKILINKCNDIIRKNKNMVLVEEIREEGYSENSDVKISLKENFRSLEDDYRIILVLYYVHGFNIREIGQILNLNQNTVKTRLSRGRERFKAAYLAGNEEGFIYG